jgi:L-iditol 2-dehydrogenase
MPKKAKVYMRAAVYYNNQDVRLEEMPKPIIGAKELLVKILASGICGSDVMQWYRLKRAPLVLGHEAAGEIAEVGRDVRKFKVGMRVFVSHHVPCNSCRYCQSGNHTVCETLHTTNYFPGGFCEYIRVPELNIERGTFLLPDEVSFAEATFIEPLGCVLRGQRLADLKAGQSVIILGAGVSGLLHLLAARARGVQSIIVTDINEYRLKAARELGASAVINAKEELGCPADLVIVCTGALAAFQQALKCVDRAGTILFFACTEPGVEVSIPVNEYWRNSIKIMHSYGASPQDCSQAIELLRQKKVPCAKLITHRLSLDQTGVGFLLVSQAKDCLKVIIEPHKTK